MEPVYKDTRILDERARNKFALSEDIMMENAAAALEKWIGEELEYVESKIAQVIIFCGSGNNGADGYALARRMFAENYFEEALKVEVKAVEVSEPKSEMCRLQKERAVKTGVPFLTPEEFLEKFPQQTDKVYGMIFVDCIFGSGFHGALPQNIEQLIKALNSYEDAYRIACDVPTGIDAEGIIATTAFNARMTVTMGAKKMCLYSDKAKDYTGLVFKADLGINSENFCADDEEIKPAMYVLEGGEEKLPFRKKQNVNKGTFGHAVAVSGDKTGAAVIASSVALRFGAGLATIVNYQKDYSERDKIILDNDGLPPGTKTGLEEEIFIPYEIMCAKDFPLNTTAVAIGMGFGRTNPDVEKYFSFFEEQKQIALVLDADIFYYKQLKQFLEQQCYKNNQNSNTSESLQRQIVLTPHPKEFVELIKNCLPEIYTEYKLDSMSGTDAIITAVEKRYELVEKFCEAYPGVVLLLKGANMLLGQNANEKTTLYLNPFGKNSLSKAGSGDALDGFITALLAQKYKALDAAVTGSLVIAKISEKVKSDYALTPFNIVYMANKMAFKDWFNE